MAAVPGDRSDLAAASSWVRRGKRTICDSIAEFSALWPGARLSTEEPVFHADALQLQFGQFRLETAVNSAYRCVRAGTDIAAHPRPGVSVEVVLDGSLTREQRGTTYTQSAGQAAVTVLDEPFEFTWSMRGRSVRTVSALSMLPGPLRSPARLPSGLLAPTPLVTSYVSFIRGLVDVAQPDTVDDWMLEQAVIVLHQAVIAEAVEAHALTQDPLKDRIERYIDAHLASPRLSPSSIAVDLGVSVRAVHAAYDGSDRTVGSDIRRRRVMTAIDLFARADPQFTLSRVASEVGLSGPDHLRRSFVAVTGQKVAHFRPAP